MKKNPAFVILSTLSALLAASCADEAPTRSSPRDRSPYGEQTLTSTVSPTSLPSPAAKDELLDPHPHSQAKAGVVNETTRDAMEDEDGESANDQETVEVLPESKEFREPAFESGAPLAIRRLITAPDVEGREPIAPSSVFAHDADKIYVFLDVRNDSENHETMTVFFIGPSGQVHGGVELDVPPQALRWRTWAYTRRADEVGLWRVEVRGEAGALLGSLDFEVAEGC